MRFTLAIAILLTVQSAYAGNNVLKSDKKIAPRGTVIQDDGNQCVLRKEKVVAETQQRPRACVLPEGEAQ
jgi:hypothetical protein